MSQKEATEKMKNQRIVCFSMIHKLLLDLDEITFAYVWMF